MSPERLRQVALDHVEGLGLAVRLGCAEEMVLLTAWLDALLAALGEAKRRAVP